MGKRIEYVNRVETLERGRLMHMRSIEAPFPMQVTYSRNHVRGAGSGRACARPS
jgi:hypothetical protein